MKPLAMTQVTDERMIHRVAVLAREIWQEHYTPIIGEKQALYMIEKFQTAPAIAEQIRPGASYYVVQREGHDVGYFCVVPKPESHEFFLSKFYIRREERGKHYGRESLGFIEKLARSNNFNRITLTVNKHNASSIEAYQKMGFRITESVVQDIGGGFVMDDYRLEKVLSPGTGYTAPDQNFIRQKFNTISPRYDLLNQILSFNSADTWRKKSAQLLMLELLPEASAILDLGVGTGDFLKWFLKIKKWKRAVGVDFAEAMLVRAREKLPALVELLATDFHKLPLGAQEFDLVISAFTLRSVQGLPGFFQEIFRVLKPGGCVGLLELTRPKNLLHRLFFDPYLKLFLPWVGRVVSQDPEAYQFLSQSVRHFQSPESIQEMLRSVGFGTCRSFSFAFGAATLIIGKKEA